MRSIRLELPWPPTANHLYTVARGRKILSKRGRQYRDRVAGRVFMAGKPFLSLNSTETMRVILVFNPPDYRQRDIANLEKALVDALVAAKVLPDDSLIDDLRLIRGDKVKNGSVTVLASPTTPSQVATEAIRLLLSHAP